MPGQPGLSQTSAPALAVGAAAAGGWSWAGGAAGAEPSGAAALFYFPKRVHAGGPWGAVPRQGLSVDGAGSCLSCLGWALL